jgi:hypothetical protein
LTGDRTEALEVDHRGNDLHALSESELAVLRKVQAESAADLRILYATRYAGTQEAMFHVQFGADGVHVPRPEVDQFVAGGEPSTELRTLLESGEKPSRVVLFAPEAPVTAQGRDVPDPMSFARAVQQFLGEQSTVFLATDLTRGIANLARLPELHGSADVAAYIPDESFGVHDFGAIGSLRTQFRRVGIQVTEGISIAASANLIMISGHKDAHLRAYVSALGRAGALRGKYLALFSCYSAGDLAFNAQIIREFGAIGVHFFSEELNPYAVGDALVKFGHSLRDGVGVGASLDRLLGHAARQAIGSADTRKQRSEIEKLTRGVTQISREGASNDHRTHA